MALAYVQVFEDKEALIAPLDDAECGRLFRAILAYGFRHEAQELSGNERYIWPVFLQSIDACTRVLEEKRASGQKGGKAKTGVKKRGAARTKKARTAESKTSEAKTSESDASEAKASENKQTQANASILQDAGNQEERNHEAGNQDAICKQASSSSSEGGAFPSGRADDDDDGEMRKATNGETDAKTAAERSSLMARWAQMGGTRTVQDDQTAGELLTLYGKAAVERAMTKAFERAAGGKWAYVRRVLENERAGAVPPVSRTAGVQSGDVLLRKTAEERRASYLPAIIDFDDD